MQNFKSGLNKTKLDLGIVKKVYYAEEEEKEFDRMKKENIPILDEIYIDSVNNHYYRYVEEGVAKQEIDELLAYRQIDYLRTIKNCMIFLVIAAAITLFISMGILLGSRY